MTFRLEAVQVLNNIVTSQKGHYGSAQKEGGEVVTVLGRGNRTVKDHEARWTSHLSKKMKIFCIVRELRTTE